MDAQSEKPKKSTCWAFLGPSLDTREPSAFLRGTGGGIWLQECCSIRWGKFIMHGAASLEAAIIMNQFGVLKQFSLLEQGAKTGAMCTSGRAGALQNGCCTCGEMVPMPLPGRPLEQLARTWAHLETGKYRSSSESCR